MNALIERLKEPSTYAGLAGIALIVGINAEQFQEYVSAVAGVFAFVAMFMKEAKS